MSELDKKEGLVSNDEELSKFISENNCVGGFPVFPRYCLEDGKPLHIKDGVEEGLLAHSMVPFQDRGVFYLRTVVGDCDFIMMCFRACLLSVPATSDKKLIQSPSGLNFIDIPITKKYAVLCLYSEAGVAYKY